MVSMKCSGFRLATAMAYENERPWCFVVIVRQVPDEVAHYSSNNQAGNELEESKSVEESSRILAWSRFRSTVECSEHCEGTGP